MSKDLKDSPNYIGMGMLSIPVEVRDALYHWEDTRQQAKHQYGYHRENMLVDADNQLVLAIEEYAATDPNATLSNLEGR